MRSSHLVPFQLTKFASSCPPVIWKPPAALNEGPLTLGPMPAA